MRTKPVNPYYFSGLCKDLIKRIYKLKERVAFDSLDLRPLWLSRFRGVKILKTKGNLGFIPPTRVTPPALERLRPPLAHQELSFHFF